MVFRSCHDLTEVGEFQIVGESLFSQGTGYSIKVERDRESENKQIQYKK